MLNLIAVIYFRRLERNMLEDLDSKMFLKLRNLKILDLSHNNFLSIPEEILHSAFHMKIINFSFNTLKKLPEFFLKESQVVEEFDVSRNSFSHLDNECFAKLIKLKILNLAQNSISEYKKIISIYSDFSFNFILPQLLWRMQFFKICLL